MSEEKPRQPRPMVLLLAWIVIIGAYVWRISTRGWPQDLWEGALITFVIVVSTFTVGSELFSRFKKK